METLVLGVAVLLTVLFLAGWILLLLFPLVVLTSTTVGGFILGATGLRHRLPGYRAGVARGILVIDGLAAEASRQLRADLVRVLGLAPRSTRPRACACVKPTDGAFAGVLRVFDTRGHWLFQTVAASADEVAVRLSGELATHTDRFPAPVGAPRPRSEYCDPRACPLRRAAREHRAALQVA